MIEHVPSKLSTGTYLEDINVNVEEAAPDFGNKPYKCGADCSMCMWQLTIELVLPEMRFTTEHRNHKISDPSFQKLSLSLQ